LKVFYLKLDLKFIVKIDKTIHSTNKKTGEITKKTISSFAIANFKDNAKSIKNQLL
jgi:hypothetical protein